MRREELGSERHKKVRREELGSERQKKVRIVREVRGVSEGENKG